MHPHMPDPSQKDVARSQSTQPDGDDIFRAASKLTIVVATIDEQSADTIAYYQEHQTQMILRNNTLYILKDDLSNAINSILTEGL